MSMKKLALFALAGTALAAPSYASNAEIDQLMKEINKLKAQVSAIQKKAAEPAPSAGPVTKPVIACEAHGNGFFVIPGTSSCLRISGYSRAEASYVEVPGDINTSSASLLDQAELGFAGRLRINTDVRSSTEMGTLRGFGRLNFNLASGSAFSLSSSSGALDQNQAGSFSSSVDLEQAYVSLGGWSIGRQDSAFLFYNQADSSIVVPDDGLKILAASYTHSLGSGLSGTLALENPMQRSTNVKSGDLGMANVPEIVGGLQLINGPLTAKLSAASHQVVGEATGDTKYGYAYQGGVKYGLTSDTTLWLQGTYAEGAMSYLGYGIGSNKNSDVDAPADVFRSTSTVISSDASDGLELSKGWSVLGALNHKLGSDSVALIAVYGDIENNRETTAADRVYGTLMQVEANYTFRPFEGLNIQPAFAYQSWQLNSDAVDVDRYASRIRVWREF